MSTAHTVVSQSTSRIVKRNMEPFKKHLDPGHSGQFEDFSAFFPSNDGLNFE